MTKIKISKKKIKKLELSLKSKFVKNLTIVFLVGSVSFLLAKKYKSQFIVATVNYQPISRFELNKLLTERYGQETLNELINQALIKDLLKANNIKITEGDIEEEINNLKTQLGGGEVFETTLAQYGLTLDQLKERLTITLGQKKLAQGLFNLEVTDEEVSQYYIQNKAMFETKTLEEVTEEIKTGLLDQKLQQEFNTWFTEQKEKASIRSFI
ncbi:hypothetical protein KKG65_03545 [Patescibacteria group bacterium]|nr:hypothetical protein [Patescibacteria group bacterium]